MKPKQNLANIEDENTQQQQAANNSLELTHVEMNQEQLLHFNGKINGHPAWILLDSGASRNFIDEKFVT